MAIELIAKIKPKNNGTFAMVDAADVELANGARLESFMAEQAEDQALKEAELAKQMTTLANNDKTLAEQTKALADALGDISVSYPIETEGTELQPETYYAFGEVGSLSVSLLEPNDGKVHEYCFEFIPSNEFSGLTIEPAPKWANDPQFVAGKTCQVSIIRGIGVTVSA